MELLSVVQGTPEWDAERAPRRCASEAPAMMGASSYMTRNELLRLKKTGIAEEVTSFKQELYDRGHAAEAASRPFAEQIIGADLYPATGVSGTYLASFDGITMDEETAYEHKLWNEALAAQVRAQSLEPMYYWQLEHQILVSGVKRVLFMVSDGTPDRRVWMFYEAVPGRAEQLVAGWVQFDLDLAVYVPTEAQRAAVGTALTALPALTVALVGEVTSSNLVLYREKATAFIGAIKTDLQTDQDFADAATTVKFCKDAEEQLALVKQQALSQTASIAELFSTVDQISAQLKQKRLDLDKLVELRKTQIKNEIVQKGKDALAEHIAVINTRLAKVRLPAIAADFAAAIKGKRTVTSLQDAVDGVLARAKIEANAWGEKIDTNLRSLRELAAEHSFLFMDAAQIVMKDNADLVLLINSRIAAHKETEAERIRKIQQDAAAQAERELLARQAAAAPAQAPALALPEQGLPAVGGSVDAPTDISPATTTTFSKPRIRPVQTRPTDEQIIACISEKFPADRATVVGWLRDFRGTHPGNTQTAALYPHAAA